MNVSGRTRTYTWEDPIALRDAGAALSGLDYLKAVFETKLPPPPIAATLDFTGAEVEEGESRLRRTAGRVPLQPNWSGAWRLRDDPPGFGDGVRGPVHARRR